MSTVWAINSDVTLSVSAFAIIAAPETALKGLPGKPVSAKASTFVNSGVSSRGISVGFKKVTQIK